MQWNVKVLNPEDAPVELADALSGKAMTLIPDTLASAIHDCYRLVDIGRYEEASAIFEENGVLEYGLGAASPGSRRGAQIRDSLVIRRERVAPPSRHISSNHIYGPAQTKAQSVLSVLATLQISEGSVPSIKLVADIEQFWVRFQSRWKRRRMLVRLIS